MKDLKKNFCLLFMPAALVCCSTKSIAQQKEFEGRIRYDVSITVLNKTWNAEIFKRALGYTDSLCVHISKGFYKRSTGLTDEYFIPSAKKAYVKFIGIDTLYYRDYTDDSSIVLSVDLMTDINKIAGYECKKLLMRTTTDTSEFYYAPDLYLDAAREKDHRIGNYDAYVTKTNAVYLKLISSNYNYTSTCTAKEVLAFPVNDSVFKLPDLPVTKLNADAVVKPASFHNSMEAWTKYVANSINPDLAPKYLKLKRGETIVSQIVKLKFMVTETGEVADIVVLNEKEVHPKLAEEAVRVIQESPRWAPCTVLGKKVPFYNVQNVTFQVTKE